MFGSFVKLLFNLRKQEDPVDVNLFMVPERQHNHGMVFVSLGG